jgi:hypothetical protein
MFRFRPRLRFTLRAFGLFSLAAVAAWWAVTYVAARRADAAYQEAQAMWEAETLTTMDLCQKSFELRNAQLLVPFADRRAARVGHLERITYIWEKVDAVRVLSWMSPQNLHNLDLIKQMQLEAQRDVDDLR